MADNFCSDAGRRLVSCKTGANTRGKKTFCSQAGADLSSCKNNQYDQYNEPKYIFVDGERWPLIGYTDYGDALYQNPWNLTPYLSDGETPYHGQVFPSPNNTKKDQEYWDSFYDANGEPPDYITVDGEDWPLYGYSDYGEPLYENQIDGRPYHVDGVTPYNGTVHPENPIPTGCGCGY